MTHLINRHISGTLLVIISISIQIIFWFYQFIHTNKLSLQVFLVVIFPIYFIISSFFIFYSVNIVYNIFVPPRWIEQNSQFLSFTPKLEGFKNNNSNYEQSEISCESFIELDKPKESQFSEKKSDSSDSSDSYNTLSTINSIFSLEYENLFSFEDKPVMLTIQIPVYTEDFDETLFYTFENVRKFVNYYNNNSQNWRTNVLINEDGLQKVSEEEKNKRIAYYNLFSDFFYIARPVNGRAGKFKKASNMNFGLRQILKINNLNNSVNKIAEWEIQSKNLNFLYKESNAHSFQIGKYILLIDSDSKFNNYALPLLINEMEASPNIGYIQVRTNSNKVIKSLWENAISHFTNTIYDINFLYSCSNGFPSPLVGHNAVLRWSALLSVETLLNGHNDNYDSWAVWDETRVSEDFVMSIYLQHLGYYGKYIFYDCGFKEGVSLNIIDEITKLKKYIYGINEILFYPCNKWLTDGILTHLYVNFLLSDKITFSTKYALLAYMGSYYSLALSPIVTIWYYFIKFLHIHNSNLYITNSLDTLYSCIVIFFGMSVLTNVLIKMKHKFIKRSVPDLIFKELLYGLYLTVFFSSISFHLLSMMIVYFCGLQARWETTKKEAEKLHIRSLIWMYKYMYVGGIGFLILIIYGLGFNEKYNNTDPKSIIPLLVLLLSHMLFPIYAIVY